MQILLVDDDPDILGVVTQFLTLSTRHEVVPAASAQEALEAISTARKPFDCVLSDIQMPAVDGIALVQMIRQTPGYEHIPIIMLTAMQDRAHLDRAFFSGASDYLAKPFDFKELQQRLCEVQKLAADKRRLALAVPGEGDFRGMGNEPKGFTFGTPIPLPAIDKALDDGEFENYVRQLLRRQLFKVAGFAVRLHHADRHYAAATTETFTALLSDVGDAIGKVLLSEGGALCYRGNGIFLCVVKKRLRGRRGALQDMLNQRIRTVFAPTGQIAPRLAVGDCVALSNRSESEALEALARAVENVATQVVGEDDIFEVHGRLMKQQRFNDEQRRLEKRAFESLLRDTLDPPTDDAWTKKLFRRTGPRAGA